MFHTVYKVTHITSGKFYIGYHATLDPWDEYFGSGLLITRAISLHGKNSFTKVVLHIGLSRELALELEKKYVGWSYLDREGCYNVVPGGGAPPTTKPGHCKGKPSPWKGKSHSEHSRKLLREANLGKKQSEETKKKRAAKLLGRKKPWRGGPGPRKGVEVTTETRERMSKAAKLRTSASRGGAARSAITQEDIDIIREMAKQPGTIRKTIAALFGVSRGLINDIVLCKRRFGTSAGSEAKTQIIADSKK